MFSHQDSFHAHKETMLSFWYRVYISLVHRDPYNKFCLQITFSLMATLRSVLNSYVFCFGSFAWQQTLQRGSMIKGGCFICEELDHWMKDCRFKNFDCVKGNLQHKMKFGTSTTNSNKGRKFLSCFGQNG
ncbi:hypothetical protein AQUCO_04000013v1 [Aquilegia coerulea]|uniref:CCHC-type domain-containing protein n=1 Tax=Aquilegia coerulea TaxID=218851 RepID=A0A2G5CQU6_AQUCA|nr:hypothetical protein AQUCO_04000013v1 [Aquilegia coerulea]